MKIYPFRNRNSYTENQQRERHAEYARPAPQLDNADMCEHAPEGANQKRDNGSDLPVADFVHGHGNGIYGRACHAEHRKKQDDVHARGKLEPGHDQNKQHIQPEEKAPPVERRAASRDLRPLPVLHVAYRPRKQDARAPYSPENIAGGTFGKCNARNILPQPHTNDDNNSQHGHAPLPTVRPYGCGKPVSVHGKGEHPAYDHGGKIGAGFRNTHVLEHHKDDVHLYDKAETLDEKSHDLYPRTVEDMASKKSVTGKKAEEGQRQRVGQRPYYPCAESLLLHYLHAYNERSSPRP